MYPYPLILMEIERRRTLQQSFGNRIFLTTQTALQLNLNEVSIVALTTMCLHIKISTVYLLCSFILICTTLAAVGLLN